MSPSKSLVLLCALLLFAPFVTAASAPPAPAAVAPPTGPANDDIADAYALALGVQTQSTVNATTEVGEPQPCGGISATVWYAYAANETTTLTLDTRNSSFDTVLAVYVGSPSNLTAIACVDDVDSLQARLRVNVTAGTTYYVQAGGFYGHAGDLVLAAALGVSDPIEQPNLRAVDARAFNSTMGGATSFGARVVNTGAEAPQGFTVAFFVDGQLVDSSSYPAGMPSGHVLQVFGFANGLAEGEHVLEVVADVNEELSESDESDNVAAVTFHVAATRDLAVRVLSLERVPLETEAGSVRHPRATHEATVEVCNRADFHDQTFVQFQLESGNDGETRADFGGYRYLGGQNIALDGGACATHKVRFDTAMAVGDFSFYAFVDGHLDRDVSDNMASASSYNVARGEVAVMLPWVLL